MLPSVCRAALLGGCLLIASVSQAQNIRSAVSLTGNDAANCTVPTPCRTFGAAIAATNTGGEVIALSSAGYGPFTIDKSISIIAPAAFHAAIAPTSGDAITVNVDNAVVVIRGLTLNGSLGGDNGILFTGQTSSPGGTRLYVEHCVISGFQIGLAFNRNGALMVNDTVVRQSSLKGIFIDGSPGFRSSGSINRALLHANGIGLHVDNATVAIRDSVATGNSTGFYSSASHFAEPADLSADRCEATHNFFGFHASSFVNGTISQLTVSNSVASANFDSGIRSGTYGLVRASNNTVIGNGFGGLVQVGLEGDFETAENNIVRGHGANDTFGVMTPIVPK